jgi:signal transduction histidine kinase
MPAPAVRWARPREAQSLGARLVFLLTLVGLAGALAITVLLAAIITPSFNTLEGKAVGAHVDRTRAALAEYASKVESAVRDYGDWTASYDYMERPSAAFERESFSPLAMANLDVAGMAYIRLDGSPQIARWIDTRGAEDPSLRARLLAAVAQLDLPRLLGRRSSTSFYLRLGDRVAAIGVAKVRRSDGSGSPHGWVLMARTITSRQLAELLQLGARVDLDAHGDGEVVEHASQSLRIAVPILGPDHHAVASATFAVPREVTVLGRRMLMLAVAGSTLLLLMILVVLRRVIARSVLAPLHRVEAHMQMVRASGSLTPLELEHRPDEIGSLTRSFNAMLRQLKDLREQIEVQSFALGRSESAVAVMHNVRNALNPISTILSQGVTQASSVDHATFERAVAELARDDLPPARRQKLAAFLAAAGEAVAQARDAQRRELQIGRESMAHVLEIIGQQQQQAHERPELEVCDVADIVARNATIARYSGDGAIAFSFPKAPTYVLANRVILSQVIGNMFSNAAEAIAAADVGTGTIAVSIAAGPEQVTVSIRDNGEGFDAAVGGTLFQRGFSTREHKSGGLGLHWCANSMTAMDGGLRLESDGRGRGATATLTLKAAGAVAQAA